MSEHVIDLSYQVAVEDAAGVAVPHPGAARDVRGTGPRVPEPVGGGGVCVAIRAFLDRDAVHLRGEEVGCRTRT